MRYRPIPNRQLIRHQCQFCGRDFFVERQGGRPRLFCDKKCRQADFRHTRYLGSKRNESPPKTETKSKTFRPDFGDRPSPLNILGGYRWPNSAPVDRELLAKIIRAEIGDAAS
jgi:hypothetical protein